MRIAVIPARGGSKRIPRKNIRPFLGKPIISYPIEAALKSGCFDKVIVSTDDEEIAKIARRCGADTPFLRPASLADDHTGTADVIKHALQWFKGKGDIIQQVCCLYATAPFVESSDIIKAFEILLGTDASYVFAVTSYPFPIQRALKIDENSRVDMFNPEYQLTRSQDLEEAFHDAGQFYWGLASAYLGDVPVFSSAAIAYKLPRNRVQDIDTEEDWLRAEILYKINNECCY